MTSIPGSSRRVSPQSDRLTKLNAIAIAIREMRTPTANAPDLLEAKSPENDSPP